MCDTLAIVGKGGVLFAKSSDRDPNEPQLVEWHPAREHREGAWVQCTHIRVAQVPRTHAVLLSRPAWMWGAEVGANEHGVIIGNEAVFTRTRPARTGLTGMDILRLALERARTADQAVEVIADLVESHDQGGRCGYEDQGFSYHSSFLVADPERAWVVETAGRRWAKERVVGARAISNGLSIPEFAAEHADPVRSWVSACAVRRRRTETLAEAVRGASGLARILRDHGPGRAWPEYSLLTGGMRAPCMHAGGVVAAAQTTASWVSELDERSARHWVTATSSPCLSLFKPVQVGAPLDLAAPGLEPDGASLFWAHERLHRQVMRAPDRLAPLFLDERNRLERAYFEEDVAPADAFAAHSARIREWTERVSLERARDERPAWVRRYWKKRDRVLAP